MAVPRQPKPYLMLRLRLIEEASAKYFVGTTYFGHGVAVPKNLREHLVVENEIIGVRREMRFRATRAEKAR